MSLADRTTRKHRPVWRTQDVRLGHLAKQRRNVVFAIVDAFEVMFSRLASAARQTVIYLNMNESDNLALGPGRRCSCKKFINQKAGVPLVSPVAGVDSENLHIFGSTLKHFLKWLDHFIFHPLVHLFSKGR